MPADPEVERQSDILAAKAKHYLITTMGRFSEDANIDEVYRALCFALREEIMINWLANSRTYASKDVRMVYYLSMEYLPGRILTNNLTNLGASEIVRQAVAKLNRNFNEIINCESDPSLGNGGLGRLASCILDSLATQSYPAIGYGLRYQYGTFQQQLWEGVQVEVPDIWLVNQNPWEFRRDLRKVDVKYCGQTTPTSNIHGDEILTLHNFEEVWALPHDIPIIGYAKEGEFSVVTLRLWSTKESPRNFQLQRYNAGQLDQAAENTTLTDVLYPSDHHEIGKRIRLKQEYLLVSASVEDIVRHYLAHHDNFRSFADKVRIQINDTHPALTIAELIRILTEYDIPWKTAVEITQACCGYTNHTILSEALEQWDRSLFYYLLPRQYKTIERLNFEFCNSIRSKYANDEAKIRRMSIIEEDKVRMSNLSIIGSHKVNGVAKLHTEILKNSVFRDFYEAFPDKFINVTNGVTQRRWLLNCNPELAKFITHRIGPGWITDFSKIIDLAPFADDPHSQEEFHQIKKRCKHQLIDYLNKENLVRDNRGIPTAPPPIIDVNSLFDVQVKRIHEYKRQLMNILHLVMVYFDILENPHHNRTPRTAIFGGKAAAGYETARDTLRFIHAVARRINKDPHINGLLKIILVENYNVTRAEVIIPAADLSEQISLAGMEASGTGNMKLSMNGALTIGTDDGANIEMRESIGDAAWPFAFGVSAEQVAKIKQENSYHSRAVYESDPHIKRAVDTLRDRTFAHDDAEHQAFSDLFHKLIEGHYGGPADRFLAIYDLNAYAQVQKKVEDLFQRPSEWQRLALLQIAHMGPFTIDRSVKDYSDLVWGLTAIPADPETLERVRHEYSEIDVCRIYP